MTLEALISRCETGQMLDVDFEHPLAKEVLDELAQGAEEERQAALFADVRKLSDAIVEQYLTLDREDKLKMAHVYGEEECFKRIWGLRFATKERIEKNDVKNLGPLGKDNINLLLHISNYSKLVPILKKYVEYIQSSEGRLHKFNLAYYLRNHTTRGEKTERKSKQSMESLISYDFKNNCKLTKFNNRKLLESLTYGIPSELKEKVEGSKSPFLFQEKESLIKRYEDHPLGKIISTEIIDCLENEAQAVLFTDVLKVSETIIEKYLSLEREDKVKMAQLYCQEEHFKKIGGIFTATKKRFRNELSEESLTLLLQISNYSKITSVLENYIKYIETSENIAIRNSTLQQYLKTHDIKGKYVEKISESLQWLIQYDFRNNCKPNNFTNKGTLESLIFGVPNELRERVENATSLLPVRIRILENYVTHIESGNELCPSSSSLANYIRTHNLKGEEVKRGNGAMSAFRERDFKNNEALKKPDNKSILESLICGVPEDLKIKVTEAEILLSLRIRILRDYVNYIENNDDLNLRNSSLFYYLKTHNLKKENVEYNSEFSLRELVCYDFEKKQGLEKKNRQNILKSLTYGVPDELKKKATEGESLLPLRVRILKNYIRRVEKNKSLVPETLAKYLRTHNTTGERVGYCNEESMNNLGDFDFKNYCKLRNRDRNSTLESFTYGVQDQELVAKVRQYALQGSV